VLGDIDNGRARIEQQGQWLNVKTSAGYSGYVAAWLVSMTQPSPTPPAQTLTVYATDVLNLRAQSTTNAPVLTSITAGQALIVSEATSRPRKRRSGSRDNAVRANERRPARLGSRVVSLSQPGVKHDDE